MKISAVDRNLKDYQAEQARLQHKRDTDFRALEEKKKFDNMIAERVSRNIRLGLDKGRNIDTEC
jgi:hypothetical protein